MLGTFRQVTLFRCLARSRLAQNTTSLEYVAMGNVAEIGPLSLVNAEFQEGFSVCRCGIDLGWRRSVSWRFRPTFREPTALEGSITGPWLITSDKKVWSMHANFIHNHQTKTMVARLAPAISLTCCLVSFNYPRLKINTHPRRHRRRRLSPSCNSVKLRQK